MRNKARPWVNYRVAILTVLNLYFLDFVGLCQIWLLEDIYYSFLCLFLVLKGRNVSGLALCIYLTERKTKQDLEQTYSKRPCFSLKSSAWCDIVYGFDLKPLEVNGKTPRELSVLWIKSCTLCITYVSISSFEHFRVSFFKVAHVFLLILHILGDQLDQCKYEPAFGNEAECRVCKYTLNTRR